MTNLQTAIRWLENETQNTVFGTVGVSLVIHNGKVQRIEKTIVNKTQIIGENK